MLKKIWKKPYLRQLAKGHEIHEIFAKNARELQDRKRCKDSDGLKEDLQDLKEDCDCLKEDCKDLKEESNNDIANEEEGEGETGELSVREITAYSMDVDEKNKIPFK